MIAIQKVIIWDNDGTIIGSKDPNDKSNSSKVVLPNVEKTMRQENVFNVICSGMKTPESESQNFDPENIIARFKVLMLNLPVSIAIFSPAIGGTECWVLTKNENNDFSILKAHEDERYQHLIGQFKKPDIGMLTVVKDLLQERGIECNDVNTVLVGDAWQDMKAAHDVTLPFLHAGHVHCMKNDQECWNHTIHWQHGQELIAAWQDFFNKSHWQDLIKGYPPIHGNCGIVYELPNFLNRSNEGLAIVDMCQLDFAEPHYHPDLEVYFVLQGEAQVVVGNEKYSVKEGDVVVIPPFKAHYTIPNDECVIACINTPPYTPESYIPLKESNASVEFESSLFEKDIRSNKWVLNV